MNKNLLIILGLFVILAAGGFIWYQMSAAPDTNNQPAEQTQQQENPIVEIEVTPVAKTFEVAYTSAGYAPGNISIKAGDSVVFKNQSSMGMWTASGMHPMHSAYSGTSLAQHCPDTANTAFDACKSINPGESWTFTFTKTGSWGYHNHSNSSHFGKITVE